MAPFAQVISTDLSEAPLLARGVTFCAFTDVNEQARAFDGWDLNYTQISGGRFHGSSSILTLGGVRLLVESLDKVILQQGAVPTDRLAFAVPLELEGHARMCGERSGRDSLHVFSSLPEFEFYSPDHHVLVNVEIEPDKLQSERLRALANSLRAKVLAPVVPMSAETAETLRTLLRHMLAASTESPGARDEDVQARIELLERTVLFALSEIVQDSPQATVNGRATRYWALVHAVQERLQDPAMCPLTIAELCVQLDMSRRTLQYAFHQALNLNPVAYLRAVRLNHVRRELRRGESVTSAATRWGFWHLGNFAQDYRTMFGELPSVTTKRYARNDI
ncbi:helix-turn-helix domain-containing protein [Burkholderia multivorans]|uniref:helix-turn-helix domain-containing protein n=1 Tax=Burkholderia multivorans TaxID=87883 RepID=UPI000CFF65BA|nr:helix-turn-helix domain-containing protein [Burkholderia multivorans]MBU9231772.1 helix-turn-helix domain-containing protein [Burkholderia multivorans]MCA8318439.1 helix-turn-helix domain-containing protein [Burkholderia multivorans]MDN7479073.1 helix-turn-helix domain-containing protein [Burkholderia multivorans]MDN7862105.1 helix-turn-helix domain-containing protein [Burkholderia multivorans]PRE00349.1 AraC family transcriptional regulator [Burkholderia multivorans]